MSRKIAGKPAEDITTPSVSLTIKGETYHLSFTFQALSVAKANLIKVGNNTRLLQALMFPSSIDVDVIPSLFYASLITQHPELTPEDVAGMISIHNFEEITYAVLAAYEASRTPGKPNTKGDDGGNGQAA